MVSVDTLTLPISTVSEKKIISLFNLTFSDENECYNHGVKLPFSNLDKPENKNFKKQITNKLQCSKIQILNMHVNLKTFRLF